MELLSDPTVWISFLTLTVMEIVLGIDNIVFISVIINRLPPEMAERARKIGLALALIFRIILLMFLTWIIGLQADVFEAFGHAFSWRDIILIAGGVFLVYKATAEIHEEFEGETEEEQAGRLASAAFSAIIGQIIIVDMVFSVDSIITAIGMAEHVEVMIAAVVVAIGVMYFASGTISDFIRRHPTTKMLALAFLLLIGVSLVADGFGFHIPRGYIYAAMGFSVLVETFNIMASNRRRKNAGQ
ncbi:TerC family protein [Pseudahrensia aquimaris]|uniref:TerC family protein n=1 Tax=Pseudahrensia aquimaris TaxID=744461 RepID=A0ABW3FM84_9HYPH